MKRRDIVAGTAATLLGARIAEPGASTSAAALGDALAGRMAQPDPRLTRCQ